MIPWASISLPAAGPCFSALLCNDILYKTGCGMGEVMGKLLQSEDQRDAKLLFEAYSTTLSETRLKSLVSDMLGLGLEDIGDSARSFTNRFILANYPNETTIKANFINKVLLPLSETTVSIFELPIGKSRVDICKVNGHSAAYEIKTDLDSFYRLESQLADYFDVFETVYVITSEKRWDELPDYVPAECGIYSYRQRKDGTYAFSCRRKATKATKLDAQKQLLTMSKKDICETFDLPSSGQSKDSVAEQCLQLYSSQQINRAFKNYLKRRYRSNWHHLKQNSALLYEIDYEWFYRSELDPEIVY